MISQQSEKKYKCQFKKKIGQRTIIINVGIIVKLQHFLMCASSCDSLCLAIFRIANLSKLDQSIFSLVYLRFANGRGKKERKIPMGHWKLSFHCSRLFQVSQNIPDFKRLPCVLSPFWCLSKVGLGGIGYLDKLICGACWPSRRPQCLTAN